MWNLIPLIVTLLPWPVTYSGAKVMGHRALPTTDCLCFGRSGPCKEYAQCQILGWTSERDLQCSQNLALYTLPVYSMLWDLRWVTALCTPVSSVALGSRFPTSSGTCVWVGRPGLCPLFFPTTGKKGILNPFQWIQYNKLSFTNICRDTTNVQENAPVNFYACTFYHLPPPSPRSRVKEFPFPSGLPD